MTTKFAMNLLDEYKQTDKPPSLEDLLDMLREEFKMTALVYGKKLQASGAPYSTDWLKQKKKFQQRLACLDRLADVVKEKQNLGTQTNLFENDDEKDPKNPDAQ